MSETETFTVVAIIALLVGVLIGYLIARFAGPASQQKTIESELAEAKTKLDDYQRGVTEHFQNTAKIVADLSQNYRDLHDHLSRGASDLASPDISHEIQSSQQSSIEKSPEPSAIEPDAITPPKDYAPKAPGEHGVLSEEFALNKDKDEPGIEVATAQESPRAS